MTPEFDKNVIKYTAHENFHFLAIKMTIDLYIRFDTRQCSKWYTNIPSITRKTMSFKVLCENAVPFKSKYVI